MFQKLPMIGSHPTGEAPATPSGERTQGSEHTTRQKEAAHQVDKLFSLLPPQDVADAEMFLTASVALFAEYPPAVMIKAVYEIPRLSDRPKLRLMTQVLNRIYAPIERDLERQRARQSHRDGSFERRTRTPDEQARVDAQVARARCELGIAGPAAEIEKK